MICCHGGPPPLALECSVAEMKTEQTEQTEQCFNTCFLCLLIFFVLHLYLLTSLPCVTQQFRKVEAKRLPLLEARHQLVLRRREWDLSVVTGESTTNITHVLIACRCFLDRFGLWWSEGAWPEIPTKSSTIDQYRILKAVTRLGKFWWNTPLSCQPNSRLLVRGCCRHFVGPKMAHRAGQVKTSILPLVRRHFHNSMSFVTMAECLAMYSTKFRRTAEHVLQRRGPTCR